MEDYHFNSNIIINGNNFYLSQSKIKIISKNINKYYKKIGFNKLENGWYYRINKLDKINNFNIFYLDNIPDGNCFFTSISDAININNIRKGEVIPVDYMEIRKNISLEINEDNFENLMVIYQIEKLNNDFNHLWDIEKINNYLDLRKELCKSGNNYWADYLIIELFKQRYKLNLIILNSKNNLLKKNKFKINCLGDNINKNLDTIFLYLIDGSHFRLISIFVDDTFKTIFNYDEIPDCLIKIYEEDSRQIV